MARVAFAGRTSTEDQQDPTLSLPRQLRRCSAVIPDDAVIVAHFFDIESGRMDLSSRGRGSAHELFDIPIPRDGGIQDLLAEAERPDRRFDYVICESIDRIARRTYYGTYIEHHLEKVGVRLLAADEPIQIGSAGRRKTSATTVLTRRVKQGIAEWYVLEMLEKSWDGFAVHTEQGFNIGKPPYGYRAVQIPHSVPAKRAKGVKKTRLAADPVEGVVVRQIFAWRIGERLSYQQIADRLNQDLVASPPPTPVDPARAVGRWTISNVREIITNPKHTGHMVWGRRARKRGRNRANPVEDWIWSPQPTHDAHVTLEGFVEAQQIASQHAKSRSAGGRNRHPQTRRLYRLRSHLFCDLCGRRMYGKTSHGVSYYVCAPKPGYVPAGHPAASSCWVREEPVVEGLSEFLADRIFGQYRRDLLASSLTTGGDSDSNDRDRRIATLERSLADNERRRRSLIRNLELVDDQENPDPDLKHDFAERRAELRAERTKFERELEDLRDQVRQAPNPALLGLLPVGAVDLVRLPDEISRRLFAALRLEIRYNRDTRTARCRVTLYGDTARSVAKIGSSIVGSKPTERVHGDDQGRGPKVIDGERRLPSFCLVPPAGFEPAHPPPEGGALSPELRGLWGNGAYVTRRERRIAYPGAP